MPEINITDFFNPNEFRKYITKPFNFAGKTIASDGATVAFFPLQSEFCEIEMTNPENFLSVLESIMESIKLSEFVPLPEFVIPDPIPCQQCNGSGKAITKRCKECDGDGVLEFENEYSDYECDCKTCGGGGEIITVGFGTCSNCKGTGGIYTYKQPVIINGISLDVNLFDRIRTASDLLVCADIDKKRLFFKSGDISGAIYGFYG